MDTRYYKYANIVRVLRHFPEDDSKSWMIDVNTDDHSILSIFDASKRPHDLIFINSFINILNQSTVGFKQTTDDELIKIAHEAILVNNPHIVI